MTASLASAPLASSPAAAVFGTAGASDAFAQPYARYGREDHAVWASLYARQRRILERDVCTEFADGLRALQLPEDRVPHFDEINTVLQRSTGWRLVAVSGLLPDQAFFRFLADRCFPVTWWLRRADQADYLEEPDLFHDLFGHVPMLHHPAFARFIQRYGELALSARTPRDLALLARLYWFTVEFGLVADRQAQGSETLKIYGAGIVSSSGESEYSLRSATPRRHAFDVGQVLHTPYRIDSFQNDYFVIRDFDTLFDAVSAISETEGSRILS